MHLGYEAVQIRKSERLTALREELQYTCIDKERILLEIGCGHGHYLAAYAEAHPEQFCVGIDLVSQRIEKAQRKVSVKNLDNLAFFKAECMECLECLPEETKIEAAFMLFPDPWPKSRHHKKRMIQPSFLTALGNRCEPGTPFYFRTDHSGYLQWTREHFAEHPDWEESAEVDWPFENPSFFQDFMEDYGSLVALRQ